MQRSKQWMVSRVVIAAAFASFCQGAAANEPTSKQIKAIVDFQCHGVKTLKQAEANYAYMARSYTDQHPVMECLVRKIAELKAAGK